MLSLSYSLGETHSSPVLLRLFFSPLFLVVVLPARLIRSTGSIRMSHDYVKGTHIDFCYYIGFDFFRLQLVLFSIPLAPFLFLLLSLFLTHTHLIFFFFVVFFYVFFFNLQSVGWDVPHGHSLQARCKDLGLYKLLGETRVLCSNGLWAPRMPSCVPTTLLTNFSGNFIFVFDLFRFSFLLLLLLWLFCPLSNGCHYSK